ncbi:hypothetical protein PF005_g20736 [Phytophthora fragariae]|uniref:Secreted protein n=1 Tax=Phytophthora fragariae TaxID=53985 RepID=A0A6A3E9G7_9STRA|nr:hypothetical protein PF003_g3199 [Phytophthora fragariae]KAE8927700.1 hypothetical protein PF009_g22133 [Phytophthora fragariae]KAE8987603.1 hypothetical protein PF011_g19520 [Phytophthora fragariae]KAE9085992.1 hypothetical protein PF010_g20254 [Phytophthora fragariae]KAE9086262.1 hypothetical protein PF007_g20836 [Phytophthora fragariae]
MVRNCRLFLCVLLESWNWRLASCGGLWRMPARTAPSGRHHFRSNGIGVRTPSASKPSSTRSNWCITRAPVPAKA